MYLMDKFMKDTDDEHGITIADMIAYLEANDIRAERKSLYDDVETLRSYGMDIVMEKKDKKAYYKLVSRNFELAELKLLVDSVQSAKFITSKKTEELIKKLESLSSKHQAVELQRQVYVLNRVKNPNEKIYLYVDMLHHAIHNDHKVAFKYTSWNLKKQLVPKHDGKVYRISPWALTWDDENYYLICFDEEENKIKHFRVDKMLSLEELTEGRLGKDEFSGFDLATYSKKVFGMYGGEEQSVKLRVNNNLVGVIIDRFGTDINIIPDKDKEHFTVNVEVASSNQFLGWIIGLGDGVEIISPTELRDKMVSIADVLIGKYKK